MDILIQFGWLAVGLVMLFFGAEWLVRGSSDLALKLGISPLVVGLTVVAFGTSAPELLASLNANLREPPKGGLALGNVIGSNICNIGLVLGLTALLRPLVVDRQVVMRDSPILLLCSLVFVFFLTDGVVQQWEGAVFVMGIVAYTAISLMIAKRSGSTVGDEISEDDALAARKGGAKMIALSMGLVVAGLLVLVTGADLLVDSGVKIAESFGVPEAIIGLTLIAFGTSLPELATSVAAVRKGEVDLIVGNAIGSCVFNLMAVVGVTAAVSPIVQEGMKTSDLLMMLGITVAILVLPLSGKRLTRWHGGLLFGAYSIYSVYLTSQS